MRANEAILVKLWLVLSEWFPSLANIVVEFRPEASCKARSSVHFAFSVQFEVSLPPGETYISLASVHITQNTEHIRNEV